MGMIAISEPYTYKTHAFNNLSKAFFKNPVFSAYKGVGSALALPSQTLLSTHDRDYLKREGCLIYVNSSFQLHHE